MAKRRNPYLSRAKLAAVVRYSGEEEAVAALLRQARGNFKQNLSTARALSLGTQSAIDRARPGIQHIYDEAGLSAAPVAAPALPTGALDFATAAQFEQAAAQHRLGEARAAELTNLADQRLAAHAAGTYGRANARKQLQGDLADIVDRERSLGREKGAFITSTMFDLQDQAAGRRLQRRGQDVSAKNAAKSRGQSERNSIRSAGIDPDTGKPIPGGKLDPKAKDKKKDKDGAKKRWLPPASQSKAIDAVNEAATWIERLQSSQHMTSHEIRQHLQAGDTLTDANDNKLKLPKIPKTLVNAAYDIVVYGGLTQPNVRALHARGVKVKGNLPVGRKKPQKSLWSQVGSAISQGG
jgi:hypothetical protein